MKPAPVPFFAATLAKPLTVRTQIRAGALKEVWAKMDKASANS